MRFPICLLALTLTASAWAADVDAPDPDQAAPAPAAAPADAKPADPPAKLGGFVFSAMGRRLCDHQFQSPQLEFEPAAEFRSGVGPA